MAYDLDEGAVDEVMRLKAEGVENPEIRSAFDALGCNKLIEVPTSLQGHFMAIVASMIARHRPDRGGRTNRKGD